MTSEKKETRGKPKGYRGIEGLHDRILAHLKQKQKGQMVSEISAELGVCIPTLQLYLSDLVAEKKVSSRKVARLTFYRFNPKD